MEGDNNFMRYIYRGEEGEIIPLHATHVIVHESVTVIRARAFYEHRNIVEVICHEDVKKIGEYAFYRCPRLRRVIMPRVKIVASDACFSCEALTDVECGQLEIIGDGAFYCCKPLRNINLPSVRIVDGGAFGDCEALVDAKFSSKLERFDETSFYYCKSLERITIPLKDGLFPDDCTFQGCEKLKHVDLVEGELHETIAALQLDDWRNDIYEEINAINQILPKADAGYYYEDLDYVHNNAGEKAAAIRAWVRTVIAKIIHYKGEHRRLLEEDVAPTLQCFLPQDIVMNSILPFLNLPSHSFE